MHLYIIRYRYKSSSTMQTFYKIRTVALSFAAASLCPLQVRTTRYRNRTINRCIRLVPIAFSAVWTKQGDHTRRFAWVHLDRIVAPACSHSPNRYMGHSNSLQSGEPSLLFAHLVVPLLVPRQEACSRDLYLRSAALCLIQKRVISLHEEEKLFDCP